MNERRTRKPTTRSRFFFCAHRDQAFSLRNTDAQHSVSSNFSNIFFIYSICLTLFTLLLFSLFLPHSFFFPFYIYIYIYTSIDTHKLFLSGLVLGGYQRSCVLPQAHTTTAAAHMSFPFFLLLLRVLDVIPFPPSFSSSYISITLQNFSLLCLCPNTQVEFFFEKEIKG